MEAIDTVMSKELQKDYGCVLPQHLAGLEWQAEISFKAGRTTMLDELKSGDISLAGIADELRQEGIRKVVEYFSRHWMGQTKGMMLYEIPSEDRVLLEDGIIPAFKKKALAGECKQSGFTEEELRDLRHNASDDIIG